MNKPIYPLDDDIKNQCNDIIRANFITKDNSWIDEEITSEEFLISKLTEEFCECIMVLTHKNVHTTDEARKELADLINISAMIHRRLRQ